MTKKVESLFIIDKKQVNSDNYVFKLKSSEELPIIKPGQFVQIKVNDSANTYLRRPISIHDVDINNRTITLLIQDVGEGTHSLCNLKKGDSMDIIFPLGSNFSLLNKGKALLVGGGVGVAPLLHLGKELNKKGVEPYFIIGARNKQLLIDISDFESVGEVNITTEDGSVGTKGFVIHHKYMNENINNFDFIYTCGPDPMMRSVAKIAYKNNVECEVSLENMMACGIGACLCCVVKTNEGHKCTCTDGPVFNIKELSGWQI